MSPSELFVEVDQQKGTSRFLRVLKERRTTPCLLRVWTPNSHSFLSLCGVETLKECRDGCQRLNSAVRANQGSHPPRWTAINHDTASLLLGSQTPPPVDQSSYRPGPEGVAVLQAKLTGRGRFLQALLHIEPVLLSRSSAPSAAHVQCTYARHCPIGWVYALRHVD